MKARISAISLIFALVLSFVVHLSAQAPTQEQQPEFFKQGQQLIRQGKLDEALTLYLQTLQISPNSFLANIAAGSVLDLMQRSEEARLYFAKAIQVADMPEYKARGQRAVAISYAFQGNCEQAVKHEERALSYYGTANNFSEQGEIADEAARICLDYGNLDIAYKWYATGHDTGLKEPGIKPAEVDLWEFRWAHARARIAARRGDQAEAEGYVAAAKAVLDKGTNPEQVPFLPYLMGYVAFYGGDYKTALEELLKADQNDPFIQCMIGQTYEKLDEKNEAGEYYRKAATATSHNSGAAYAVPFSKRWLARSGIKTSPSPAILWARARR